MRAAFKSCPPRSLTDTNAIKYLIEAPSHPPVQRHTLSLVTTSLALLKSFNEKYCAPGQLSHPIDKNEIMWSDPDSHTNIKFIGFD